MRILHYFLGFYRSGGLNRYAADLAACQVRSGHTVFALYPGGSIFPGKRAVIKRRCDFSGIGCFELLHGKIIPLLEGIRDPGMILEENHKLDEKSVVDFCDAVAPDVVHIHTWMGFPEELLPHLKARGCRIVFSAHDYFGICPRVNFIRTDGSLCPAPTDKACSECNASAPSYRQMQLRSISFLLKIKKYLNVVRRLIRHSSSCGTCAGTHPVLNYTALREHYHTLLKMCDKIHFNSEVTRSIYRRYFPDLEGIIQPVTHLGLFDRRRDKKIDPACIRLGFIGSSAPYKGLPLLKSVLKDLKRLGMANWHLDVWGSNLVGQDQEIPEIVYRGTFRAGEEETVYRDMDLLIVPSICFETFGFAVAEALSFGIPVLCSATVGAQNIVPPEMVFPGERELKEKLAVLLRDGKTLSELRSRIIAEKSRVPTCEEHWETLRKELYT